MKKLKFLIPFALMPFFYACAEEPEVVEEPVVETKAEEPKEESIEDLANQGLAGLMKMGAKMKEGAEELATEACTELEDYETFVKEYEAKLEQVKNGEDPDAVFDQNEMDARAKEIHKSLEQSGALVPGTACYKHYVSLSMRLVAAGYETMANNPELQKKFAEAAQMFNSEEFKKMFNGEQVEDLKKALEEAVQGMNESN